MIRVLNVLDSRLDRGSHCFKLRRVTETLQISCVQEPKQLGIKNVDDNPAIMIQWRLLRLQV
jgi:hypothetical protein